MKHFRLRLFGLPVLSGPDGPLTGAPVQRHRLALLALLARAPGRRLSRDKIIGLLWPDADTRQGRHLLNVSVHELRKALGEGLLGSSGDDLWLDPEALGVDVIEFESRVARREGLGAAEVCVGPFLDGFYLDGNSQFEEWAATERLDLLARFGEVLTRLADEATARGARVEAVDWCRRLAATDPLNSRHVLRLMTALEAAGDPGNAVDLARTHEATLARELGASPDPAIRQLAERLRQPRPPLTTPVAVAPALPTPSLEGAEDATIRRSVSRAAWRGPWVMVGAAGIVGAVALFLALPTNVPVKAGRILVVPFANQTELRIHDPLGRIIADRITDGLARLDSVDVVDFRSTIKLMQGGADSAGRGDFRAQSLAAATGATRVLTGSYRASGDSLVFTARVSSVEDGRVLAVIGEVSSLAADPMPAVEELRIRGMGAVASLDRNRWGSPVGAGAVAPKYQAYLEYIEGLARLEWWSGGLKALPIFIRAFELDSTFVAPILWGAYLIDRCLERELQLNERDACTPQRRDALLDKLQRMNQQLGPVEREGLAYLRARAAGDQQAAFLAASRAARLAPQSLWTAEAIDMASERGRFEEVVRLATAAGVGAGWAREQSGLRLAWAYHELGQFDKELEVSRGIRIASPDMSGNRAHELRAMAALGLVDSVLIGLKDLVERWGPLEGADAAQMLIRHLRGHGHPEAARSVAQQCVDFFFADSNNVATYAAYFGAVCLHGAGQAGRARQVFERIESGGGQFRELALQWLGVLAAQAENRTLAERYLRRLVPPGDTTKPFSEARIAAALGDHERAVLLLRRAFRNSPLIRSVHRDARDPGWESIQGYPPYRELVDRRPAH